MTPRRTKITTTIHVPLGWERAWFAALRLFTKHTRNSSIDLIEVDCDMRHVPNFVKREDRDLPIKVVQS